MWLPLLFSVPVEYSGAGVADRDEGWPGVDNTGRRYGGTGEGEGGTGE